MTPLNGTTLRKLLGNVSVPAYDRAALRGGIVHFGVGNFHRVHLALYVDDALRARFDPAWGIVGVGLTDGAAAREKAAAYKAQDGLYTVTEFAPDGGVAIRVVGAMIDYLHAPVDPQAVIDRLVHPDARIVSLTITEGGYNIGEADGSFMLDAPDVARDLAGGPPRTVFGFVVEALARRRAAGLPAFAVVSCDNLRGNGDTSRKAFTSFARAVDPDLAAWIDREVDFPNSMVDRIAPQVGEAERQALDAASGVADRLPAKAESFNQWVCEDRFRQGRPAFETVGVQFSDDVASYLAIKGRMLNACHMLMSYPAILCGYRLVDEAMRDARIVRLLETFVDRDVVPYVTAPAGVSFDAYKAMIVERFSNPAIGDQLLRIAGDGASKLPIFHAKTTETLIAASASPRREAFLLACFARYLRRLGDDAVRDDRGADFEVFEPALGVRDRRRAAAADPVEVLDMAPFASLKLRERPEFVSAFHEFSALLATESASAALDRVLG